jgi:RNA polymerase sigma-70 factor (ECF subfamily)
VDRNKALNNRRYRPPKISSGLIKKIAQGNSNALETLYNETSSAVFGFALSIVKNKHKAEDIMQEVYIKIFQKAHTYKSQGKPMAWIFTITRNLCLKRFRDKDNNHIDIDSLYSLESSDAGFENFENYMALKGLMEILNQEDRTIVIMHALSGLKHREISSILNMPLSTVLSKYNRSIKKLKQEVENEK